MSQSRRDRRKVSKTSKKRLVGLEFNLNNISPEELKTLEIEAVFNGNGIEAIIKTDNRIIETHSVQGYQKDSKPGFILKPSNFISHTSKMGVSLNLKDYDVIIGIDTNSKVINGKMTHVGVAIQIIKKYKEETSLLIIKDFVLNEDSKKPENQNWKNLILYIMAHENFSSVSKYGIVVDSDLGYIPSYNKREKAIIDDFILPQNFELICASADTSNDALTNVLIFNCDKYAGMTLELIEKKNCI